MIQTASAFVENWKKKKILRATPIFCFPRKNIASKCTMLRPRVSRFSCSFVCVNVQHACVNVLHIAVGVWFVAVCVSVLLCVVRACVCMWAINPINLTRCKQKGRYNPMDAPVNRIDNYIDQLEGVITLVLIRWRERREGGRGTEVRGEEMWCKNRKL